jgi:hypothetical protein
VQQPEEGIRSRTSDPRSVAGAARLRISAKDLGALALDGFCPRCFWLDRRMDLPFQMGFPGIFSSIDAYTKAVVNDRIRRGQGLPSWLSSLGEAKRVLEPHFRTFWTDLDGVALTGAVDALLEMADGSYMVLDYKTARHTPNQDALLPVYRVQLNGYALIAEALGMAPVKKLALVYFEPPDPRERAAFGSIAAQHTTPSGFAMPFTPHVEWVNKDSASVGRLVEIARSVYESPVPPPATEGCEDCVSLDALVALLSGTDGSSRLARGTGPSSATI